MLLYAKETEHEKIIRALAVGVGLVMFGRKQDTDPLVASLIDEEDPLLRLGAVHALAMAYCGTGDNGAIRKLLHLAVSDVKDDVRRAAVTSLGFVLLRTPEQVPRMVELLSESFNPHVRAGAASALGIACAATGSKAAITILEPMLRDPVDFVMEAASIALAFILVQHNEALVPKVAEVRSGLARVIETKNIELVAKFGSVVAQGILDAGGRNVTISLTTGDGQLNAAACAGMLLFAQSWSWFPLAHFLALAFRPTALIAVNKDMRTPNLDVTCASRKALYAYPPNLEEPVVHAPTKVATAVLSTTHRSRHATAAARDTPQPAASTGSDPEAVSAVRDQDGESGMDVDENGADGKTQQKRSRKVGSESFAVANITRVLPQQERFMRWPAGARYVPVKQGRVSGVLVVKDTAPGEPEDLLPGLLPEDAADDEDAAESDVTGPPPEPFEYPFDNDMA
ncbi:proteasome regulatory particle base subunit [Coemansia spiralis]|nr:proteasome regulatory particle base subunit [Coemansia spiralis]